MTNEEKEALIARGWTPPVAVDPDLIEAQQIFSNSSLTTPIGMTLTGIKRGRELERATFTVQEACRIIARNALQTPPEDK